MCLVYTLYILHDVHVHIEGHGMCVAHGAYTQTRHVFVWVYVVCVYV